MVCAPAGGGFTVAKVTEVKKTAATTTTASNPTTKVVARWGRKDFRRQGGEYVVRHTLRDVTSSSYLRVRGTSTDEMEPAADGKESPWEDLWFYSNPVFVDVRTRS